MKETDEIFNKALQEIKHYSDPERIKLSAWYFPTVMKVYGLKSADLKTAVSEIKKTVKSKDPGLLIPLCLDLASSGIFECQLMSYGLLNKNYRLISTLSYKQIISMGSYMDNWVSTDSFSTQIAGPAWRLGVLKDSDIEKWALSDDKWWRRNALVATVGLNLKSQGGSGSALRTLKICKMLLPDRDDMVVKAMSWALRELSKQDKQSVENFVSKYNSELAPRAKREVIKKLTTGRKNG